MSFAQKNNTNTCADCGRPLDTAAAEQVGNPSSRNGAPWRCPACRSADKSRAEHERTLVTIDCAACGNPARVPFEPRDGRPVYCNECFQPQPPGLTNDFKRTSQYGAFRSGTTGQRQRTGGRPGNRNGRPQGQNRGPRVNRRGNQRPQ